MRRPVLLLVAILVAAGAVLATIIATRPREGATDGSPVPGSAGGLTLLVLRSNAGPFAAVIGSTGGDDGALVIPTEISLTVPGQGDATLEDALELPGRQAATAVANLLGVWVDHYAILGRLRLEAIVDRLGGLEIAGQVRTGAEVVATLEGARRGRTVAFQLALQALLRAGVAWAPDDLAESDDLGPAVAALQGAEGAGVVGLEIIEPAEGIFRAEPGAVRDALVRTFGGPDRDVVSVIVLNGSGEPGIGEAVAERIVGGGFSIVVSENASSFDHEDTLVVVGSSGDVALGERVRDLLGTGTVNVSVSSGLAPVTIVVGKDFGSGEDGSV